MNMSLARVRAVVAYPAVSAALVVAVALVLTPFGPSQVMALAASTAPTETSAPSAAGPTTAAPTTAPTETSAPGAAAPTTAGPTTAAAPAPATVPSPVPGLVPGLTPAAGDHHVLAWIESPELPASYL